MNIITSQRDKGATPPSQATETSLAVKNDNTREKKTLKDHICTVSKPNNKRQLLKIRRSSCREAHPGVMKCHSLSSAIPHALMSNLSDIIILYILYYNLSDISTDLTVFSWLVLTWYFFSVFFYFHLAICFKFVPYVLYSFTLLFYESSIFHISFNLVYYFLMHFCVILLVVPCGLQGYRLT